MLPAAYASAASTATTPSLLKESSNPINDQGSSYHYRSNITAVAPSVPGLSVQVLEFADRLLLTNHTGKTVTIYGYEGEPYARVLANGTAEQNVRAPATYLNTNFYARGHRAADREPRPRRRSGKWSTARGSSNGTTTASTGCRRSLPPEVKNKSKRTLIFDWKVPIEVGNTKGAIDGQLFWTPESSKAPLAVIILGVVIVVGGAAVRAVRAPPPRAHGRGRAARRGDERRLGEAKGVVRAC